MSKLSQEVGAAYLVAGTDLETRRAPGTRHTDILVVTAKAIARLQARRVKLRRDLRKVEADIKAEQRKLRALLQEINKPSK